MEGINKTLYKKKKKTHLVQTRTQGKGAMTPQETEPDLPVSIWESPVEVWVSSGLSWGQGHWQQQSWKARACWPKSFWKSPLALP